LQVNPPLRTADDRAAVREAMADGTIDFVSSDHAPHTPAEKASSDPPSGIPSLEWMMPLLLHFVETGILTWKRFLDVTCTAATTCFGIRGRNGIIPGGEADLAVVGPRIARGAGRIVTRAGYAPFAHLDLRWSVHATVVNGHIMWRNGMLTGSARGREVVS
jgi:dihydroorotase